MGVPKDIVKAYAWEYLAMGKDDKITFLEDENNRRHYLMPSQIAEGIKLSAQLQEKTNKSKESSNLYMETQ